MHIATILFFYTIELNSGEDLFRFNLTSMFGNFDDFERIEKKPITLDWDRRKQINIETDDSDNVKKPRKNVEIKNDGVTNILKDYLVKLYEKKYENFQDQGTRETKFLDVGKLSNIKNKTKNFLSLFQIVKFSNSECLASGPMGVEYMGVCYHQTQCDSLSGTALGDCADGYGVCCVFRNSCGGAATQNCSYFESPNYPNFDPPGSPVLPPSSSTMPPPTNPSPTPDPRWQYVIQPTKTKYRMKRQTSTIYSCSIDVMKIDDDIQQIRIDFIDLELAGPTNGNCIDERFLISGQNVNDVIPVICGYNTGQHIYVDVSMLDGPLQLAVLSNTGNPKRFKIKVCQYMTATCGNCLQYYTGETGMISSFNYDQAAMRNRSSPGYLNNLNYAVCIRKEAGYCSITYSNIAAGVEYPFQLVNYNNVGESTIPPGQAGAEIFNCPDDYVVINGVRLCGERFNDGSIDSDFTKNAPVTDIGSGPIILQVRTDGSRTGRGFKLFYMQNMC